MIAVKVCAVKSMLTPCERVHRAGARGRRSWWRRRAGRRTVWSQAHRESRLNAPGLPLPGDHTHSDLSVSSRPRRSPSSSVISIASSYGSRAMSASRSPACEPPTSSTSAPPGPQPRRRLLEHAQQDVEPLLPAVVGERGLEAERVALQQRQRTSRDVGHDRHDHVGRPEIGRDRREQVAGVRLDAVRARVLDRVGIEIRADHPRARPPRPQRRRDRARPVHRSIATPSSGSRSAARSATSSVCQRGT